MSKDRVHLVLAAEDRAAYAAAAERAGISLSQWLRDAAEAKLASDDRLPLQTVEALDRFFAATDADEGEEVEPDWEEHLAVMAQSRRQGLPS